MFYFWWQFYIWIFKSMPQIYHLYNDIFPTKNVLEIYKPILNGKYVFREAPIYQLSHQTWHSVSYVFNKSMLVW